ncbi:uncharacterized protein J3R85_019708 [Psidium guajava]|nr:uncharacterized protein J3R85_019708 [Psidium guajava]
MRVHVLIRESAAVLSLWEASPATISVSTPIDITRKFYEGLLLPSLVRHLYRGPSCSLEQTLFVSGFAVWICQLGS